MKLSIVIPNYNGESNLRNNIPKLIEVIRKYREDLEIIITDDASSDNSLQVIKNLVNKNRNIKITPLMEIDIADPILSVREILSTRIPHQISGVPNHN